MAFSGTLFKDRPIRIQIKLESIVTIVSKVLKKMYTALKREQQGLSSSIRLEVVCSQTFVPFFFCHS